ncbi:M20/M25/M40 family metallo-hydrolase [Flavobacteriaceae bacterium TK19130]|nr:M20/M25/M40 family metallo-hydrolase [Thermobacterium salinum]
MRNYFKIVFLSLIVSACQSEREEILLITEELPSDKIEYQKKIVGQLSGEFTLGTTTLLKSRWEKDERKIAKEYLLELVATLGIDSKVQHYTAPNLNPAIDLILEPFRGTNVYGILPSTNNSEEYVVLGGHYDTGKRNAPGAIDNATGIALIYSVAKELSKLEVRNRNIVVVFFDQEEEELIGSKAFADYMIEQKWNVHSIHCFDMVGWDGDHDSAMETFSASKALLESYQDIAAQHDIPIKEIVIDPVGYERNSTDFDAFVPMGFNVIGAGECFYHRDSSPYKDSPQDTFETVDFDYLLSCSNLVEDVIKKIVTE